VYGARTLSTAAQAQLDFLKIGNRKSPADRRRSRIVGLRLVPRTTTVRRSMAVRAENLDVPLYIPATVLAAHNPMPLAVATPAASRARHALDRPQPLLTSVAGATRTPLSNPTIPVILEHLLPFTARDRAKTTFVCHRGILPSFPSWKGENYSDWFPLPPRRPESRQEGVPYPPRAKFRARASLATPRARAACGLPASARPFVAPAACGEVYTRLNRPRCRPRVYRGFRAACQAEAGSTPRPW